MKARRRELLLFVLLTLLRALVHEPAKRSRAQTGTLFILRRDTA